MNKIPENNENNKVTLNFFALSIQIEREFFVKKIAPVLPIITGCVCAIIGLIALAAITSHLNPRKTSLQKIAQTSRLEDSKTVLLKPVMNTNSTENDPFFLK